MENIINAVGVIIGAALVGSSVIGAGAGQKRTAGRLGGMESFGFLWLVLWGFEIFMKLGWTATIA